MRGTAFVLIACAALLFAGPATAAHAELDALLETWVSSYNSGDDAGIAGLYVEDGCRMPPHAEIAKGREAIQANLAAGRAAGLAKVDIAYTGSGTDGDLGYGMGTWKAFDAEGNEIDHGKWMNTVRKVGDDWKIVCDIWNSDLPMPTAGDAAGN